MSNKLFGYILSHDYLRSSINRDSPFDRNGQIWITYYRDSIDFVDLEVERTLEEEDDEQTL